MKTSVSNLTILYEDNHLIAVCKKPGDIVQGDKTEDKPLVEFVKDYIKKKYKNDFKKALGSDERVNKALTADRAFMVMIRDELQNRREGQGPNNDKQGGKKGGKNRRGSTPPPPAREEPTV